MRSLWQDVTVCIDNTHLILLDNDSWEHDVSMIDRQKRVCKNFLLCKLWVANTSTMNRLCKMLRVPKIHTKTVLYSTAGVINIKVNRNMKVISATKMMPPIITDDAMQCMQWVWLSFVNIFASGNPYLAAVITKIIDEEVYVKYPGGRFDRYEL